MLLNQFHSRFPTEEACIDYFKSVRIQQGVVCPCCNDVTDKWLEGRNAFQCKKCGCSIPLTKGTVMEHSKLSLSTWFSFVTQRILNMICSTDWQTSQLCTFLTLSGEIKYSQMIMILINIR